ncbi:adhesin [Mesomycoplasma ovipneumoniae ATCC 29419]|uniref:P97 family adhesin n=1 Tax=Mesomycoplasma ovipneumoniae TaxID=29562 RepID=UPI00237F60BA|nr:adhesin [Mesomycoplasma ovipneumoniae]WDV48812.1 adhesin [Mesomycoplasma ovipneumoniae ATCC 29419]
MNKSSKSKTLLLAGGISGLIGAGIVGLTIGLTVNIKYNSENPRTQVNQFASRVSNLAFNLSAFNADSDYKDVKAALLDDSNKIKNAENALESFSFFEKKGGNLEKLDFSDSEFSDAKISYQILEILPDDANQNFKVKFQASQKLQNGDVAKSDIYEQVVSFVKESTILIAEFNFSLQKITNRLNQQVQNLISARTANFADQNSATSNPTDPSTIRPVDFQHDLNKSKDSKEFGEKISSYFPSLNNLLASLKNSQENKLPNSMDTIFNFDFARDKSTGQFVSLQNQVPSFFLEANLTSTARQMLDSSSSFSTVVNAIKLEKNDKSSYFLNYSDFFDNLSLKNLDKTDFKSDMGDKLAVEFLAQIKSGFFSDPAERSESLKSEILELLKDKKLAFSFGNFGQKFKNHNSSQALKVSFDPLEAKIDETDKTKVLIPYTISVNSQFFMPSNSPLEISQKTGTLEIGGLKQLENLGQLNSDIFKTRFLEGLGKENKQKQAVFDQYGAGIRTSSRKVAKEEIEALFKDSPKTNEIRNILERNYDLDFGPYVSLLDSWVGKIKFPSLSDIKRMTKDGTQSTRNAGVSSIESRNFFRDGHQVASFFQDLLTKDRKTFLETLFELSKKWGLIAESSQIPQSLLDSKDNIFEEANKISLTEGDIKKLSFNNLWRDNEGIGFYGTLVLPTSVKNELGKKKGDSSLFEYLKTQKVITKESNGTGTNTENYAKFEKFGDVLSAFFLKAGQFDNFKSWAKLDDNLKYTLEFTKETEQEKDELSKKIEEVSQAQEESMKAEGVQNQGKKAEGAQNQGKKAEGAQNQGKKAEGAQNQGKKAEGAQNQGKKAEGAQNQGKKAEGAQNQGKKAEGVQNQGKKAEGAQNQGKKAEGAQNQGKKAEGAQNQGKKAEGAQNQGKKTEGAQNQGKKEKVLPVKFSFKLETNDGSILNVKTPEIKVFVELEDEDIYKNRKEINELDKAVIQLQGQFRETSLDSDGYSKLTFPKKAEGAQNQGKKAEGAQNQGKKAEGAQNQGKKAEGAQNQGKKAEGAQNQTDQNSLTSYLPELGKKVEEYLETHFKDKNYKTLVESISDSFGKTTKDLFFVLVKDDSSSTSGSESSTTSTTPQKKSTLRVKITISKTETASTTTTTTAAAAGTVSSSS